MRIQKILMSAGVGLSLALTSLLAQNTNAQEARQVLYTPEMSLQQLQCRYRQALEQALKKAEVDKNHHEIEVIKTELKRIPNLQIKKQVIGSSSEQGYTGEQISGNPPFFVENDKRNKTLRIEFKNSTLVNLGNKQVYLILEPSGYKYSGTKDKIEVYCQGHKVGEQEGAKEDELITISLDTRRFPKTPTLELAVELAGTDLLIIGKKDFARAAYLEIQE